MGASSSQPAAPDEPPAPEDVPTTEVLPPPSLTSLPAELLAAICSHMELQTLSAVASTCHAIAITVDDSLWQPHLERLSRAGDAKAEDEAVAGRRITNSVQRQAAVQVASAAAEAAAFSLALDTLSDSTSSCRQRVGRLRALVCNLCQAMPSNATYFENIMRGVCHACVRTQPSVADSWRYHQSALETAAIARRDAAIGGQLGALLAPSLPTALREARPRLVFSSDVHGSSLATMYDAPSPPPLDAFAPAIADTALRLAAGCGARAPARQACSS